MKTLNRLIIAAIFALFICITPAHADEYLLLQETWTPPGSSGWTSTSNTIMELSATGGSNHAGSLSGNFYELSIPIPESAAFTASSAATMGRFTGQYLQPGSRIPQFMWFNLRCIERNPSYASIRLSGGSPQNTTIFYPFTAQIISAAGGWNTIEIPLNDPSGWVGGTAQDFTNIIQSVSSVQLYMTRAGTEEQSYELDDFSVAWLMDDDLTIDSDGDTIPDYYESAHSASSTALDPTEDEDVDGVSNLNEYIAGTDAKDAGSLFKITSFEHNGIEGIIRFRSFFGRQYTIERKNSLLDAQWTLLDALSVGDGGDLTIIDTNTPAAAAVYRLRVDYP